MSPRGLWRDAFVRGPVGRSTLVLLALRVIYAYNWFDIGPGLPGIGATFGVGEGDWGLLLAAFMVGAGLLQVPSGFMSRTWGSRRVSLAGLWILGLSGVGSAFSPHFGILLLLRGLAGAGAGMFFSPAIGLVGDLHSQGTRGVALGTFGLIFGAGASLGVFGSAILVPRVGWQGALILGALPLLALTFGAEGLIPRSAGTPAPPLPRGSGSRIPMALRLRSVWALGLAFTGIEGAAYTVGQYLVPYVQITQALPPESAGILGALFVFPQALGGPLGGRGAEKFGRWRWQMALPGLVAGGSVALIPELGSLGLGLVGSVFAVSYGYSYAVMYVLPRHLPELPLSEVPLAIGLFNGIQLAGAAACADLFALIVASATFSVAWMVLGTLAVVPMLFLAWVPAGPPRPARTPSRGDGEGDGPSGDPL